MADGTNPRFTEPRLEEMTKKYAINFMADLEQRGKLKEYVTRNYPEFVDGDGEVMTFSLCTRFNLW